MAIGRIPEPGTGIPESIVDAKGDLVTATAADTPARLAVGSNEQRLVADSAAATGLKYVADTTNYAIAAKGDLLVGTAADTLAALSVGTNGHTLVADSAEATGLKWAAPASGGGFTLLSTNSLSGASSHTISTISGSYKHLVFIGKRFYTAGNAIASSIRFNSDTGSNYYSTRWRTDGTTFGATDYSPATSLSNVIETNNDSGVLESCYFTLWLYRYTDTDEVSGFYSARGFNNANDITTMTHFTYNNTAAVDSITIFNGSSSNITGTLYVYGVS